MYIIDHFVSEVQSLLSPFLVAKVFVCGSVAALGLVFESLWSIGFVMSNISSMYLFWASLGILLTSCLDSR